MPAAQVTASTSSALELDAASSLELLRRSFNAPSGEAVGPSCGQLVVQNAVPAVPVLPTCIFCGGRILSTEGCYKQRRQSLTNLGQFVMQRCRATPYAYQFFSGVRGEQRVLLCISCVNWQRRCAYQGRRPAVKGKAGQRPLLFIDQFVLFMLRPGTIIFPDQRCVLRLLHALRREDADWVSRLLMGLLPVPVQAMVLSLDMTTLSPLPEANVLHCMVRAWWEYNGRTVFFAHHLTAKLVRRIIKKEKAERGGA